MRQILRNFIIIQLSNLLLWKFFYNLIFFFFFLFISHLLLNFQHIEMVDWLLDFIHKIIFDRILIFIIKLSQFLFNKLHTFPKFIEEFFHIFNFCEKCLPKKVIWKFRYGKKGKFSLLKKIWITFLYFFSVKYTINLLNLLW